MGRRALSSEFLKVSHVSSRSRLPGRLLRIASERYIVSILVRETNR
jgi:hypothetical protein